MDLSVIGHFFISMFDLCALCHHKANVLESNLDD